MMYQVERKEQAERITGRKELAIANTYALADEYTPSLVPCMRIITLQYSGYRLPAPLQRSHLHGVHLRSTATEESERAEQIKRCKAIWL